MLLESTPSWETHFYFSPVSTDISQFVIMSFWETPFSERLFLVVDNCVWQISDPDLYLGQFWTYNWSVRAAALQWWTKQPLSYERDIYPNLARKRLGNKNPWNSPTSYKTILLRYAPTFFIKGGIHLSVTFQMTVTYSVKTYV